MFATLKSLIPEPREADQPRRYVGRHRQPEAIAEPATAADLDTDEDLAVGAEHRAG